ncbi:unnamed protein product [Peniophora sp. CBMAI 1063]|nr:unnamed protein product [Peniophora sp. CBMAI 1063]
MEAPSSYDFWESHRQARMQQFSLHAVSSVSSTERDHMRKQLLSDAEFLSTMALDFNRHVNNLNAISHLPPEILLHIFRSLAEQEPPSYTSHVKKLGWIHAGHVCHTWRVVILSASELWARSIGSLPAGTAAFIERAKQYGLWDVKMDTSYKNHPPLREVALPLERLQSLSWTIRTEKDANTTFNMFAGKIFPQLQELETTFPSRLLVTFSALTPIHAPKLRIWSSSSSHLPLRGQSLTHMHMFNVCFMAADLLETLAHAPRLIVLELKRFKLFPSTNSNEHLWTTGPVRLLSLQSFIADTEDISGSRLNANVVSHMKLSSSVALDIDVSAHHMMSEEDYALLVTILRDTWPSSCALTVQISGRKIECRPSDAVGSDIQAGTRSVSFRDQATLIRAAPLNTLHAEFEQVNRLIIVADEDLGDEDEIRLWADTYSLFPNVRELDMRRGELSDLSPLGNYTHGLQLPRLERLRLSGALLKTGWSKFLIILLHNRAAAGGRCKELWLEGMFDPGEGGDEDVQALRALVPEIHWSEG